MEPVTHMLTGACLSRTGLNRKAAYATLTMVVAAEFPDIDTLWGLRGPIEGFQHHRGITHTFLGLPLEAAILVGAVYGWHRWRVWRAGARVAGVLPLRHAQGQDDGVEQATANASARAKGREAAGIRPLTAAPVRWGVLYGLALVGLLSHLLLDYTNNYGLRPFFPFNDRWYAASIVFIFDPVIFVLLLGALTLPWLFGLVGSEVGARKQPFRARGWAIAVLLGVVAWWGLRAVEHARAVQMAMTQSLAAPVAGSGSSQGSPTEAAAAQEVAAAGVQEDVAPAEPVPVYLAARRALASPDPLSPFQWTAVMDFGPVYQMAEIDTRSGELTTGESTYPKPGSGRAVRRAEASKLGRVYTDWSPIPFVEVTRSEEALGVGGGDAVKTVVTFRDPRFMGGWMRERGRSALSGTVGLDAAGRVVRETMGDRVER